MKAMTIDRLTGEAYNRAIENILFEIRRTLGLDLNPMSIATVTICDDFAAKTGMRFDNEGNFAR